MPCGVMLLLTCTAFGQPWVQFPVVSVFYTIGKFCLVNGYDLNSTYLQNYAMKCIHTHAHAHTHARTHIHTQQYTVITATESIVIIADITLRYFTIIHRAQHH